MQTNENTNYEEHMKMERTRLINKREKVVSGKISALLYEEARMALGDEYMTMNDLVEEAVFELIARKKWTQNENGWC